FAALHKVPGYPAMKSEGRRRFVAAEKAPASLEVPADSDTTNDMRGALREAAEALLDLGHSDARLVSGIAYLRDHEHSLARLEAAQDALEHEAAAVRETAGDREISLRFALSELQFPPGRDISPDDAAKIRELEDRLAKAVTEGDRLQSLKQGI